MPKNNAQSSTVDKCPLYKKCGGCQLQNMTYPEQLHFKQAKTISLLGKFAHVNEIIGMENPYHYRNKVQAAFGMTQNKKIISGVYQSSSHRIVNVDECMTENEVADRIIVDIRKMLPDFKILPYNEDSGKGMLRHVLVKYSFETNEVMVVLVAASPIFPMKKMFTRELILRNPQITTVVLNTNNRKTSMLLGNREEVLYGSGYIEDVLCGCRFRISAKSFYQINPVQTQVLYNKAIEYAGLNGTQTVLDAYCGTGTIGIIAAKSAKSVLGIELNQDAVKDAKYNARLNKIDNIDFVCADAGQFMTEMADNGEKADVLFMDPPRAGSDNAFLDSAIKMSPKKIVYISCNPETQKRDLFYLTKQGYKVIKIQPVDMFPHTAHVETVALLTRKDIK